MKKILFLLLTIAVVLTTFSTPSYAGRRRRERRERICVANDSRKILFFRAQGTKPFKRNHNWYKCPKKP